MTHAHWSDDEIEIVKAHYAQRGMDWVGWEMLLPDRTPRAIRAKANKLGVFQEFVKERRKPTQPIVRKPAEHKPPKPEKDPYEKVILKELESGMTCAQIDAAHHWHKGRTNQILTEMWARKKGKK